MADTSNPYDGTGGTRGNLDASAPGFWSRWYDAVEEGADPGSFWQDEVKRGTTGAATGAAVVAGIKPIQDAAKRAATAADKYLGFFEDHDKVVALVNTVMVIVVVLGIVYVVAVLAPVITAVGR